MGKKIVKFKKNDWEILKEGLEVEGFEGQPITQVAIGTSEENGVCRYITEFFFEDILSLIFQDNSFKLYQCFTEKPQIMIMCDDMLVEHNHKSRKELDEVIDALDEIDISVVLNAYLDMKSMSLSSKAATPGMQILRYEVQKITKTDKEHQFRFLLAAMEEYLDERIFGMKDNPLGERLKDLENVDWNAILVGSINSRFQNNTYKQLVAQYGEEVLKDALYLEAARRQLLTR